MELGLVGLGRMGANMAERSRGAGHTVVGFDRKPDVSDVTSLKELVERLAPPRVVWVMVPAGDATRHTVAELADLLDAGDIVVDGGNSRYTDDIRNAETLADHGIGYVDCGVSGGVWGLEVGYGLMAGGDAEHVERLMPIFDALRPSGPRDESFVHAGQVGAGHYAKMVHNGVEYGLMQAYAEGYELLEAADVVHNVSQTLKAWSRGTVVRSWLLDLLIKALDEDPELTEIRGYVDDSGEGRWTVQEAIDHAVPAPVITAALYARFGSRQDDSPAMKAVAALRHQFGGHAVTPAGEPVPSKRTAVDAGRAAGVAGPSSGGGDTRG